MNWKTTAAFAALLALAAAAYLLYEPEGTAPPVEEKLLFHDLRTEEVTRIEISRPGGAAVAVERVSQVPPHAWRVQPGDRPAEPSVVHGMLNGIGRFSRTGSLEPGRPESDPAITGLDQPRLSVTFVAGGRRETVRFGSPPPTNVSAVFCRLEGDPRILLAESELFQAYDKTSEEIRSRRLVRFDPHRIARLEIEDRFTRVRGREDREIVYEKSVFERSETPPDRGWFLREPWEERLDDMKVQRFLVDLAGLTAEEFRPEGDWKERGLEQPQLVASITPHGAEEPVVVRIGGRGKAAGKEDCLYVHVAGAGEVALVERERYERLPRHRGQFRSDAIFLFREAEIGTVGIEAPGLGKVLLERREVRTTKEEEDLVTVRWEVLEPGDVPVERERLDRFLSNVWVHRITDFLGEQPDLSLFGLDPPGVTMTVRTKDGREHVLRFGLKGEGPDGYLKREDRKEVFAVKPELVQHLRRLELNFRTFEMYNVPKDALREFRFESKEGPSLEPTYYILRRDPRDGAWKFADKGRENDEPDPDRLNELLAALNFIRADAFISREPEEAARHRLRDREAASTLWIFAEGGPEGGAVLYISKNLSERPGGRTYYARFEGDPAVFQLGPYFVESLKMVPVRKKE